MSNFQPLLSTAEQALLQRRFPACLDAAHQVLDKLSYGQDLQSASHLCRSSINCPCSRALILGLQAIYEAKPRQNLAQVSSLAARWHSRNSDDVAGRDDDDERDEDDSEDEDVELAQFSMSSEDAQKVLDESGALVRKYYPGEERMPVRVMEAWSRLRIRLGDLEGAAETLVEFLDAHEVEEASKRKASHVPLSNVRSVLDAPRLRKEDYVRMLELLVFECMVPLQSFDEAEETIEESAHLDDEAVGRYLDVLDELHDLNDEERRKKRRKRAEEKRRKKEAEERRDNDEDEDDAKAEAEEDGVLFTPTEAPEKAEPELNPVQRLVRTLNQLGAWGIANHSTILRVVGAMIFFLWLARRLSEFAAWQWFKRELLKLVRLSLGSPG